MLKVIELRLRESRDPISIGRVRASLPAVAACVLNVVDDVRQEQLQGPYGSVLETWVESLEDWAAIRGIERAWEIPPPAAAYHVSERVQKTGVLGTAEDGRTHGAKAIYLVRRRSELSDAEATRLWKAHAPVAREHHTGMARYVQNGVIEALTTNAPVYHGIAVLHFPTLEDFEERMYSSPVGRESIRRDAERLVEESVGLVCGEFVLRAPA